MGIMVNQRVAIWWEQRLYSEIPGAHFYSVYELIIQILKKYILVWCEK